MTNRNIDLPSKRSALVNEIEKPLRRKFRSERDNKDFTIIVLALILLIGCTVGYFYVGHKIDEQKQRADQVIQEDSNFYDSFCVQAKKDHVATGEKESADLINLCGN